MRIITWHDMHKIGRSDNARRWFPNPDIAEYFDSLRPPSRVWPHSYAKAAQTAKFSRWLLDNRPAIAQQLGIANTYWIVETHTLCDGWANTWHDDEQPVTFDGKEAAQTALAEFLRDQHAAVDEGCMDTKYNADNFRITEKK